MSAPRLPKSEKYWKNIGKRKINDSYKNAFIYTHDDLDGIYSAVQIRNVLTKRGYNILGYGIINYQESWKYVDIDESIINVAVDYAQYDNRLDIFVDHHGEKFGEENNDYKIKTATCSAFEGINLQYNIPNEINQLAAIDMVDSAKYDEYYIPITSTCEFDFENRTLDWEEIKKSKNPKLMFAGKINQIIKRSDYNTLIETIHHTKEPSIYEIYKNLKYWFEGNSVIKSSNGTVKYFDPDTEKVKSKRLYTFTRGNFIEDGVDRIAQMYSRTLGKNEYIRDEKGHILNRKRYTSQDEYVEDNWDEKKNRISTAGCGMQVIGDLVFVPSGLWTNAIRARALVEKEILDNNISNNVKFILLQYGNTLQMVSYNKIENMIDKPIVFGKPLTDIGKYMEEVLDYFKREYNYIDPSAYISTNEDETTIAGGHKGIGSISNILGKEFNNKEFFEEGYGYVKFLDIVKNKIIQDVSNIPWDNLKLIHTGNVPVLKDEKEMDYMTITTDKIRKHPKEKSRVEIELENKMFEADEESINLYTNITDYDSLEYKF